MDMCLIGSVGLLAPNMECKIVNEDGKGKNDMDSPCIISVSSLPCIGFS